MDVAQLSYLLALAEERNFTRAAARCHITQQSLSAAISRLERTVGVGLVTRTTRSVTFTEAGEAFLARARRAVAELNAASADARAVAAGHSGRVTLGFHGPGADLASPLLELLAEHEPDITVTLRRADFTDPSAGVISGRADLGLVAAPLRHRDLRSIALMAEPMQIVAAADHPLAQRRTPLDVSDLRDWPIAEMPNPTSDPLLRQWNDFWSLRALEQPPATVEADFAGVEEWLAGQRHARYLSTGPASAARLYPTAGIAWLECAGLPACRWRLLHTPSPTPAATTVLRLARQHRTSPRADR